jgi:sensor histidine kinase YesM
MSRIKLFLHYLRTHIWIQISFIFMMSLVMIIFCYQVYMRKAYENFLVKKNHLMESAVLDAMQMNIDYTMMEYINMGVQIAVAPAVYDLAGRLTGTREDPERDFMILKATFATMANYSKNVINISVASEEGEVYQYDRLYQIDAIMWRPKDSGFLKEMYKKLYERANDSIVPKYLVSTEHGSHPTNNEPVFHIFYPIVGKENSFSKMHGMLCVTFRLDMLQPFMDILSGEEGTYSQAYVTEEGGRIICHSNPEYTGKPESVYREDGMLFILDKPLEKVNWQLHVSLDKDQLDRSVMGIIAQGMGVYVFLLLVVAGIFYLIIRKVNKPLRSIETAMELTASGSEKLRNKVVVEGEHEIWQLAIGYNDMIDKLVKQEKEVEKNYQLCITAMERQHQAEREALETQINAHFLCNTLGTINYEAMECGNFKVSELIKKLSNILRYTFDQKCQNVYMYQEFAWIEQYLFLQKARLEDVFDYEVEFPEECVNWSCCKLMLQPFVENAILHGFEGRESGGTLSIQARKEGERLTISIRDNGCGISLDKLERIRKVLTGEEGVEMKEIGIGIRNVAARMRLFYGAGILMEVTSAEGEGTEFRFFIPEVKR